LQIVKRKSEQVRQVSGHMLKIIDVDDFPNGDF
jgi:hypothetical protein